MNLQHRGLREALFSLGVMLLLILPMSIAGANRGAKGVSLPLATVYYVAPNGKDTNPGSLNLPWKTIQKAADTLVAGDTVYIRAGTYPEQVVVKHSGNPGNYITFAAYPGEAVTIDGSNITLADDLVGLFHIEDEQYIRVSGLHILHAGPNDNNAGIMVLRSNHIIIENNSTYHTNSSGIGVWWSNHVTVDGNRVEEAGVGGSQECISIAGTDNFEVRNNEVVNCHKEGIDAKDGSSNGQVYRNHVHQTERVGIYVDAWDKFTHDIEVFQNVVHDVSDSDGFVVASEMGGLLQNIHLYNNIAYHNRYLGFSISLNGIGGPMDGIYIVNNTVYDNGWVEWGGGIAVDNPNAQNVVVRNNIVSQNLYFQITVNPDVPAQGYTIDHNLIDGYRNHEDEGETHGEDFVEGDPRFFHAPGANFYLQVGSPAMDAGIPLDAPTFDFDGLPRPLDGDEDGVALYDLGAYEMPPSFGRLYVPITLRGF